MAFKDQKQSKTLQDCVPTEMVQEILFRLPVVLLLRCKCVCKLWFSLISDPYFINRHAKNNESAQHHLRRLLLTTGVERNIKTCHLCDVLHDEAAKALEIDHPFKDEVQYVSIVGSCNGLLCLHLWDGHSVTYCIWNPSTRRSSNRFSPCDKRRLVFGSGFGYDESTDDYKVVELSSLFKNETKADTKTAHIYSLKSGRWKNFCPYPENFLVRSHMKFLNGALHWLVCKLPTDGNDLRIVVSFDLATECYGEVSTPPDYDDKSDMFLRLGAFGEWLCVVCSYRGYNCGDLWVMKEYGVTSSWIKLFSIPYPTHFMRVVNIFSAPLCILDEGKFLLRLGPKLVVYDSKNDTLSEIQSIDNWHNAITFVESLVSPASQ